ncbi:MAG: mechanosensitive ion channel, partial [Alistipes sp.]|nr:mechanosensitive ion channel [Alistipes sp.]
MHYFLQSTDSLPLMLPDSVQKQMFAESIDKLMNLDMGEMLTHLTEQAIWVALKLVIALLFFVVGRWLIRSLLRLLDRLFERKEVDLSVRPFIRNTLSVALVIALLLVVVQTLGVNVTSLIAIFSAATLAIGMALSGTAQNFAGGVMILVVKPYRVGDYITAQGQSGTVREIKLFSTVITTVDNQTIYIPNNVIATGIIDNF